MITAIHTLIYADDPTRARNFFRDVLGLTIDLQIPGGPEIMLYQARYEPPALGGE